MKKIIFGLFGLSLFLSALNAACYVKPAYPGSGPAPQAYCWDISTVFSANYPSGENTSNKSTTTYDHGGNIVGAVIDVYGYGDSTSADVNYDNMSLIQRIPIVNSYKIVVGYRYTYQKYSNTYQSGMIRAKNYSSVMDSVYFK